MPLTNNVVMETIKLEGSPAQLLAAEDEGEGDDEPLSIHEPPADDADEGDAEQTPPTPEQLSPEQKETRRHLIRKISRYRSLFKAELADISTSELDTMTLASLDDLQRD